MLRELSARRGHCVIVTFYIARLQILCKLAIRSPAAVLANIEVLMEPLDKTINKKVSQESAGGPEIERAHDLVKSAVRVVITLSAVEEVEVVSRKWRTFTERLRRPDAIAAVFTAVEHEKTADIYN